MTPLTPDGKMLSIELKFEADALLDYAYTGDDTITADRLNQNRRNWTADPALSNELL